MKALKFTLAITFLLIFYLSWISDADLNEQPFIPEWLGKWTNAHYTLRTAVPFVLLGILFGILLASRQYSIKFWVFTWLALSIVVLIAEAGQLLISSRVFDWEDVLWGVAGAFAGLSLMFSIMLLGRKKYHDKYMRYNKSVKAYKRQQQKKAFRNYHIKD